MYQHYYGLRELPFDLTANPRYVVLTPRHREVLSTLQYGILGRKGITVLLGEAGTGKTTLVRAALESDAVRQAGCVCLNNPTLTREEFVEFLAHGFDLGSAAGTSKVRFLRDLEEALISRRRSGLLSALVIDEAQSLPRELLEEIRLLANIETPTEKLLPVVLAGQPDLADRLNEPSLRQLKQRIALRCSLLPLDVHQTALYIADRVRTAGGDASTLFTRDAVVTIHERSLGIPRTISVICDNALIGGFAAGERPVGAGMVREVCRDLDLPGAGQPIAAPVTGTSIQLAAAATTPPSAVEEHKTVDLPPLPAPQSEAVPEPVAAADDEGQANPQTRELFSNFSSRRRFSFRR
jgi:general secretion pathway protein A